jgi:hypothetical protein
MTDNTNNMHLTENEREMIEFAKQYQGRPIIEAQPQVQASRFDPSGMNGRTTIVNGEAVHQDFNKNALVLRSTDAGGAGTGSPFAMHGTMATDPSTVAVKLGGVSMSAQAARDAVAKGWFSQGDYNAAVVEAMQPYQPGFDHNDLASSFK